MQSFYKLFLILFCCQSVAFGQLRSSDEVFSAPELKAVDPKKLPETIIVPDLPEPALPPQLTLKEAILLALRYDTAIRNAEIDRIVQKWSLASNYYVFQPQYSITGAANATETDVGTSALNGPVRRIGSRSRSASLTPQVSLNNSIGGNITASMENNVDAISGNYNPRINFKLTQPLLRGFGIDIALIPLMNAVDQEKLNKLILKRILITEVSGIITQYRQLVQNTNALHISQNTLQRTQKSFENTMALIKVGRKAGRANLQNEADIARQEFNVTQAINTIDDNRVSLLNKLGLNPLLQFTIVSDISIDGIEIPEVEPSIKLALENNVAYVSALISLKASERALTKAMDDARWQLNLTASTSVGGGSGPGRNSGFESLVNDNNVSKNVTLGLSIPINDITRKSQIISAKANYEKAKLSLAQQKRELESSVRNTIRNLKAQKEQIRLAEINLGISRQLLADAEKELSYGRKTPFEVSSQRNSLTDAENSVVTNKISFLNTITTFEGTTLGILLDRLNIQVET